ncbi:MAG: helix-turn-helix domain-containing protein [Clostridiales bacterium]|nr:helix-turn-helix domain-containing protein [Clostridiales bacterium]
MQFGNIEAERSRNGLTRTELASRIGVSLTTYKRYMIGETPIPSDKLIALARAFDCTTDYLLGLDSEARVGGKT